MTNRMPCSITDEPDDEQIIPEPEFERDTSLVDTLKDITLSQQINEVQNLIADLKKRAITKRQAE